MSDIIHLLPDSVANQIAAGEVIQRPASVIKELVENSVDAGATEIEIYIKDAGRTLIQVIDNGRGMSETDARMAFERHATSKIQKADDLFTLRSMGFRGEALPSICAISQIELRTRTRDSSMGTRLTISGTDVQSEPDVCEQGTSIAVRNLFYNVPARRKFLKSDSVELTNIMREFERLALVNNNVRMKIDTGSRSIDLLAGTFRQRIGDLWKNNLNSQLVPVEIDTQIVKISGFISRPEFARRRNALQYLIVNGRNMRHPYFHKAILNCFEPLIAPDTQPCYFIRFEVDPASIDVNIHPTKNEIKFEFEQEIWKILSTAVKSALGMFSAVPSIDFDHDVVPVSPLPQGEKPAEPDHTFEQGYNPFASAYSDTSGWDGFPTLRNRPAESSQTAGNHHENGYLRHTSVGNWESLYADFMDAARADARPQANPDPSLGTDTAPDMFSQTQDDTAAAAGTICMQVGLKYIVSTTREGLLVIDQHRAHTLILFSRYMARAGRGEQVSQRVLFPESVTLDAGQRAALSGVRQELASLGYIIETSGPDNEICSIVGAPPREAGVAGPKDVILRMLDSLIEDSAGYGKDVTPGLSMLERTTALMARASAITRGRRLTQGEMENLVAELFSLPDPAYTPDGKTVFMILDNRRLEQLFG